MNNYLGYGPVVDQFEKQYAVLSDYKYNIGLNSASAAAFIFFQWLRQHGKYTIYTPSLGFTSPAWSAKHAGHKVVFTDVDDNCLMVIPAELDDRYFLMPVLYGGVSRTSIPASFLENTILDSAHCVSPTQKASAAFFSFFCTKPLRMINGGILSTDLEDLAEYAKLYRNFGRIASDGGEYTIGNPGFRFYMDQVNAQMGLDGLPQLTSQRELRKAYSILYESQLSEYGYFTKHDELSSHYLCTLVLNEPKAPYLREKLGFPLHYPPLHLQSFYTMGTVLSKTEYLRDRILNLPIYHELKVEDISNNINRIKRLLNE